MHAMQITLHIGVMKRSEPIETGNREVNTPVDEVTEAGEIVVEGGYIRSSWTPFH